MISDEEILMIYMQGFRSNNGENPYEPKTIEYEAYDMGYFDFISGDDFSTDYLSDEEVVENIKALWRNW